jgi:folate-binding protein YgfZ
LIEAPASAVDQVKARLEERGARECSLATFDTLRIEAGVPLFGVDFDDANFPQEVGRDHQAISFTKGCYLGQETVARIDALGHVNQRLVSIQFARGDVPAAGTQLTRGGHAAGHVTSATYSARLKAPLALAMLRREAALLGAELESPIGAARVVALPLDNASN